MSNFSGLFVRHYMGQTPDSGGDGWSGSPDIIFSVDDKNIPQALTIQQVSQLGTTLYNQDFGSTVQLNQLNYVYLRALNTTGANTVGRGWFFYAESDLALWPGNWRSDNITVGGFAQNYQDIALTNDGAIPAGQVGASQLPYLWTPPSFRSGHSSGDHYCCISITKDPIVNPPVSPVANLPNFSTWNDLVNFIISHPNMGWRNTQDLENLPYWQKTLAVTGPEKPGQVLVGVQCTNMPANDGGKISFTIPGLVDPVTVPIYTPNAAPTTSVLWPGRLATSMTITYWQGATTPPANASITPVLVLAASQISPLQLSIAQTRSPYRIRLFDVFAPEGSTFLSRNAEPATTGVIKVNGNVSGLVFGSTPLRFPGA